VIAVSQVSKLFVFWLVVGFGAFLMPEPYYAIGHEQVDHDENDAGNNKCDIDCVVDHSPIRSQWSECPWTEKMKNEGADNEQDQNYS